MEMPTHKDLLNPTLKSLHRLGGSATVSEIYEEVIELESYPDEIVEQPHSEEGSRTELEYRLAWARTYLKKYGLINNSKRGVWSLTDDGFDTEEIDPYEVDRFVRGPDQTNEAEDSESESETEKNWRKKLREILQNIPPEAFENLCKRMLREAGFVEVETTRRSGDKGIDGKGIFQLSDLISFHVVFQSKRWKGNIGADVIRDFRGSMQGRADKGLIITTSTFTRAARKEASRDGAIPIDLMDGEKFIEKLKELEIGLEVQEVVKEEVNVDEEYYDDLGTI